MESGYSESVDERVGVVRGGYSIAWICSRSRRLGADIETAKGCNGPGGSDNREGQLSVTDSWSVFNLNREW